MLFNINEAIKIRNHYYFLMKGQPFTNDSHLKVSGILISRPKDLAKSIQSLVDAGFDDRLPFITSGNQAAKEFEIYVIADDGANIYHHELDNNLNEKGIVKIYLQE